MILSFSSRIDEFWYIKIDFDINIKIDFDIDIKIDFDVDIRRFGYRFWRGIVKTENMIVGYLFGEFEGSSADRL